MNAVEAPLDEVCGASAECDAHHALAQTLADVLVRFAST